MFRPITETTEKFMKRVYEMLSVDMRQTFAPVKTVFSDVMLGYDPHFLQLTSTNNKDGIRGLLVFNQDSYEPSRVNLYHLSSVDESKFEEVLDMSLEFIWKTMHCSKIRVFLHHYKHPKDDNKIIVNEQVKNALKQRRFKWQQLRNDPETGLRIEVLEGANLEFKEQLTKETAFIYRRGLNKEDFMKNSLSFTVTYK